MATTLLVAGVDEAGRGPLCGPVYAAAVILDDNTKIAGINDSKKLSEKQREKLFDIIIEVAVAYAIARAEVHEIDEINILQASLLAMRRAILGLQKIPNKILVDGNFAPKMPDNYPVSFANIIPCIKGDANFACISAASILAKVARDREMLELAKKYPGYGIEKHKGYPTKEHLQALKTLGPVPNFYRISFRPVKECYTQSISSCFDAQVSAQSGAYTLASSLRAKPATKSQLEMRGVYEL